MKLNSNSQLGLNISKKMVEEILASFWSKSIKNIDINRQRSTILWVFDLFSRELKSHQVVIDGLKQEGKSFNEFNFVNNKNYLVAKTAIEMATRIKIYEDEFDVKFLSKVKDQKITFLLGSNKFIRYVKRGNIIFAIQVSVRDVVGTGLYMEYVIFTINTVTGEIGYPNESIKPLSDQDFKFFVQLLVFTELSKLEIKLLKPKEKFGTRKAGKYINESNQDITIVDSVWNKLIIRTEGFDVSGHWRFQRCGKDFSEVEYIFIEPFRKKGYIRGAKSANQSADINQIVSNESI